MCYGANVIKHSIVFQMYQGERFNTYGLVTQCVVVLASDANAEVFTNHVFIGGTETTATALKFCLL